MPCQPTSEAKRSLLMGDAPQLSLKVSSILSRWEKWCCWLGRAVLDLLKSKTLLVSIPERLTAARWDLAYVLKVKLFNFGQSLDSTVTAC